MSRPRKINQPVQQHLMISADVVAEIALLTFSKVQGCVPLGAISAFYEEAARAEIKRRKEAIRAAIQSQDQVG